MSVAGLAVLAATFLLSFFLPSSPDAPIIKWLFGSTFFASFVLWLPASFDPLLDDYGARRWPLVQGVPKAVRVVWFCLFASCFLNLAIAGIAGSDSLEGTFSRTAEFSHWRYQFMDAEVFRAMVCFFALFWFAPFSFWWLRWQRRALVSDNCSMAEIKEKHTPDHM